MRILRSRRWRCQFCKTTGHLPSGLIGGSIFNPSELIGPWMSAGFGGPLSGGVFVSFPLLFNPPPGILLTYIVSLKGPFCLAIVAFNCYSQRRCRENRIPNDLSNLKKEKHLRLFPSVQASWGLGTAQQLRCPMATSKLSKGHKFCRVRRVNLRQGSPQNLEGTLSSPLKCRSSPRKGIWWAHAPSLKGHLGGIFPILGDSISAQLVGLEKLGKISGKSLTNPSAWFNL